MIKDLENLIKELNDGKLRGAPTTLAKMLKISDVSVHNWLVGKAIPSKENLNKIAKKVKRNPNDIQKIFIDNSVINSYNKESFNNDAIREIELLKKEIELKDKEIYLLKKEIEMLKK